MHDRGAKAVLFSLLLISLLSVFALAGPLAAQDNIHIVQPGENLFRISLRYNVTVAALAQANNITNTERIYVGQQLIIPDPSAPAAPAEPVETAPEVPVEPVSDGVTVENSLFAGDPTYHVVQSGETLAQIANRYGLTVDQLIQLNSIANPNLIKSGQSLTVFELPELDTLVMESNTNTTAPVSGDFYTVQPGETLADIALRNGITWPAIVQANNILDPNSITAGQQLVIPKANTIVDLGIITGTLLTGPEATVTVGKQIIVDLSDSRVYAYEDGKLIRSVLASMGRPETPTVTGNFTVQRKYESQTMSGPGYYLPNVQWISYFYSGYALHGTYWHNNFGQPMSHGCVNLPNDEALWFYEFAPVGTPVLVQL
ncbi:MAG: LysM peptidoglycan-binding domain-containing protein [Anaerolineae bacterium]|nr:LysM peptidoglycan-binding domain-containing protein [Anaerolineae bacterium]